MSHYHIQRAKQILASIHYATLATVSEDGTLNNSPVQYDLDADLNIYWTSDKNSQHSRNVRNNGKVSIVIYDSTAPVGKGEGVYFEATATELDHTEKIINTKSDIQLHLDEFQGKAVRRIYKASPIHAWLNDVEEINGQFIRDYKVKLSLDLLK